MPRKRSNSPDALVSAVYGRSRRPWWIPLLVLAVAWLVSRFNTSQQEAPQREAQRETTRRETSQRNAPGGRTTRPSGSPQSMEGGKLVRDRVTKVSDGDTVRLERLGSIRLIGVDTPESNYQGKSQPGGKEAGEFLRNALLNRDVEVELCAKQPYDRYGRGLGFIYATNRSGQRVLINQEIIRQGYGRVYSLRPCTVNEAEWGALYEEARRERRGLFATLGEVPDPVAFRRKKR